MAFLGQRKPSNPVSLAGDVHSNWAMDLKANFDNPQSATVGSEFVCTSISSGGDGEDIPPLLQPIYQITHTSNFIMGNAGMFAVRLLLIYGRVTI
jgi:alkaline phosphatase D